MRVSLILRAVNKEGLSNLKKIMDNALAEAPQYLLKVKKDQQQIVFDKIKHLNRWYTKIIGLDEVKVYQERVTALQDQLLKTQTKRRELNTHLTEIRQKALEIQSQIQHIDRKEKFDAYCHLINDERTILNMERTANATFKEYDQAERELFTAFTNAVRDSQEKQRSQLEYSKYITMVLSLVGSFIALAFVIIAFRGDFQKDLRRFEDQLNNAVDSIKSINAPGTDQTTDRNTSSIVAVAWWLWRPVGYVVKMIGGRSTNGNVSQNPKENTLMTDQNSDQKASGVVSWSAWLWRPVGYVVKILGG